MELNDTIEDMTSKDYKRRFVAEYNQLIIRINKLHKFIRKCVDDPNTMHDCPLYLLSAQTVKMEEYARILRERAEIENIRL